MSFFIGIFPSKGIIEEVQGMLPDVKDVFDGFEIPVRWTKPANYHLTLLYLGEKLPFYRKLLFERKLRGFILTRFKLKFNRVKLGISRQYKELIYIDLLEGGEDMRKLYLELKNTLGIDDKGNFIPHLTLGRVSKELSDQEHSNISRDLETVTRKIKVSNVELFVDELKLVKSEDEKYQVLITFSDSSNIKL